MSGGRTGRAEGSAEIAGIGLGDLEVRDIYSAFSYREVLADVNHTGDGMQSALRRVAPILAGERGYANVSLDGTDHFLYLSVLILCARHSTRGEFSHSAHHLPMFLFSHSLQHIPANLALLPSSFLGETL